MADFLPVIRHLSLAKHQVHESQKYWSSREENFCLNWLEASSGATASPTFATAWARSLLHSCCIWVPVVPESQNYLDWKGLSKFVQLHLLLQAALLSGLVLVTHGIVQSIFFFLNLQLWTHHEISGNLCLTTFTGSFYNKIKTWSFPFCNL